MQLRREAGGHLRGQPARLRQARRRQEVGVGGGHGAHPLHHGGVDLVERIGAGVVEPVGPLDDHGAGHAHRGVGHNVVVRTAREAGHGMAEERRTGCPMPEKDGALLRHFAQHQGQQVAGEGGAGEGRVLAQQHRACHLLLLADHVHVERPDQALPLRWRERRHVRVGAGHLRRVEEPNGAPRAGAGAGPDQLLQASGAASITVAGPVALSLALGFGWQRWEITSTSSSVSPGMTASTFSMVPSYKRASTAAKRRTGPAAPSPAGGRPAPW